MPAPRSSLFAPEAAWPTLQPHPGLAYAACGLGPPQPQGTLPAPPLPLTDAALAVWRGQALFGAARRGLPALAPGAAPWRELRLWAGTEAMPVPALLQGLQHWRADWPEAILRLEVWLDGTPHPLLAAQPLAALARLAPLFLHAVANHPKVLTPPTREQLSQAAQAGLPLACETFLVRGRNDEPGLLRELFLDLLRLRVRPYALVRGQWLPPQQQVADAAAEGLIRALRGWISGLAVPQWLDEALDGTRAVRIPPYLTHLDAQGAAGVTYQGQPFAYPNPPRD